ncbi:subtilisin-like protease SBT1.4 [Euphorbia lathyris]|uniref:subtilisin-like protease SBT1.4 n=1 Tax=Euphorbia lathyris TaxID=212925 RepID=UPI00331337F3
MAISCVSILPLLLFFLSLASSSLSSPLSNNPQTFIVFMSKSDKPALFSSHHHWYSSIINSLPPSTHSPKILYTYPQAISGFSAHITPDQAEALSRVSGVISVIPDQINQLHTTRTPQFLGLSSESDFWLDGDFGEDIIIGVLDTGVWPGHPSFSDDGMSDVPASWKGSCETSDDFPSYVCNKKLIGARAFYHGYNASKDSHSPKDTQGHGTHTASTAGGSLVKNASFYQYAKGDARGMASKARIAVYKICWSGGCSGSDILAAFGQAIEDGVHVISLSVGSTGKASPYYWDTTAIGAYVASVQYGITVSCSAGNSGPGAYTAVNVAPWILTVGASTIDRQFRADVVLGDGRTFHGASLYTGEPLPDKFIPLVYAGDVGSSVCTAGSLDSSKVKGKIVLCDNGVIQRPEKGIEVKRAGGVGMIVRNYQDDLTLAAEAYLTPATTLGLTDGTSIRYYIFSNSPTAKIVFRGTVIGDSPPSPKVASFSSRGPNYVTAEILKPDVIAPGVMILAGWTGAVSPSKMENDDRRVQFWPDSGTSMSCPHVSGLAAVLRKAHPNWSPAAIKSALMTTAYNLDNSGATIGDIATGKASTLFDRGAGHVDPNSALDPGLIYDIDQDEYISFLCAIGYTRKQIFLFTQVMPRENICDNNMGNPGNLNYPSFSVVFEDTSSVVTYKRTVKNVGSSASVVYDVKVNAPANVDVKVSPTRLVFSEENKSLSYEITFSSSTSSLSLGLDSASNTAQSFGSIAWSDGIHTVTSPIAVLWKQGVSMASF